MQSGLSVANHLSNAAEALTCGISPRQFDSHSHLQDVRLAPFLDAVLHKAVSAGLKGCRTCGTSPEDWRDVAALANKTELTILPAFGVHPWYAAKLSADWLDVLEQYLADNPGAPVGEIGLDGLRKDTDPQMQKQVFIAQLELAARMNRPVILHGARVWNELFETVRPFLDKIAIIQLHAFSGSREQLNDWLKTGAVFSAGGGICNPKSARLREMVMHIPEDRLLFETDSPDMFPNGGSSASPDGQINQPANLSCVITAYDGLKNG